MERQVDHLLVGVTGSAAIFNLLSYLVILRATFAREIRVITTSAADAMLPASTVAHVYDDVFLEGTQPEIFLEGTQPEIKKRPGHMELARWSDAFVVLPASANVIGQAANGIAPNLLTTTILASTEPVIFCPNVSSVMWGKKVVQRNIETLIGDGHLVIQPELAIVYEVESGEMQESGAMPDPETLVKRLRDTLRDSQSSD